MGPGPARRSVLKDTVATESGKAELTEAAAVVSGGRGLKGPENFNLVENLARALGDLVVRERWQLQELHTEEGRLDEVFRSITLSDTETAKEETT